MSAIRAPFPIQTYFGGKSRIAPAVWERFGNVPRYVEPFAGSLAVLMARPVPFTGREIVNDSDGLLVNMWRALAADPEAVAHHADWPATEIDLHARHAWLVGQRESITSRLEGDPDWYDAKAAGWWLWGISLWIGGGWCSGRGPWRSVDGEMVSGDDGQGIHRRLPHASDDGQGIHRQLPYAGHGRGIHRQRPTVTGGAPFHGVHALARREGGILAAIQPLAERLRDALIFCGDWRRAVTPAVMLGTGRGRGASAEGACAVFLDPPYDHAERESGLYAHDENIAGAVRDWALANGNDPCLRIALCGYEGISMPGWVELPWKTAGGYSGQGKSTRAAANTRRERVWFSPHCHRAGLFDEASG